MGWYLSGLGYIALMRGELSKAQEFLEDSFLEFEKIENRIWAATRLMDLGDLALLTGDLKEAEKRHQEALALRKEIGYQEGIAVSTADLGHVAMCMGKYELASERFHDALARFQNLDDGRLIGMIFEYQGDLALCMGDVKAAECKYRAALDFARTNHQPLLSVSILAGFAELHMVSGSLARAAELASFTQNYSHPKMSTFSELFILAKSRGTLEKLRHQLPAETFVEAQERGKTLDLWATVDEILEVLEDKKQG
jgi:tetratricopeptide (TPR) repeat protein